MLYKYYANSLLLSLAFQTIFPSILFMLYLLLDYSIYFADDKACVFVS